MFDPFWNEKYEFFINDIHEFLKLCLNYVKIHVCMLQTVLLTVGACLLQTNVGKGEPELQRRQRHSDVPATEDLQV